MLSQSQQQAVKKHLEKNTNLFTPPAGDGAGTTCSLCGENTTFAVAPAVGLTPARTPDGKVSEDKATPYIQISCENCGNTHLINANMVDGLDLSK